MIVVCALPAGGQARNGRREGGTLIRRLKVKKTFPKKSKAYPVARNIKLMAIIDRCLDRRFRIGHRRLIEEDLGLAPENIVPIKRAGGAGPLRLKKKGWKRLPKDVRDQLELFVEEHPEIGCIILINHEDCRRYDKIRKRGECDRERLDLKMAVNLVSKKFPNKKVFGYFGEFVNEKRRKVQFRLLAKS